MDANPTPIDNRAQAVEERKSFFDYKVGDKINDVDISFVHFRNRRWLIYNNGFGHVAYAIRDFDTERLARISRSFHDSVSLIRSQLRGAFRTDSNYVLARCLNTALLSVVDDSTDHFEPIKQFVAERGPVDYVYGQSKEWIVYQDNRGAVAFEHSNIQPALTVLINEFSRLRHVAGCSLNEIDKKESTSILGSELATAFRSPETETQAHFVSSREFVTNRSQAVLRSRYVKSSVISSVVVLAIMSPAAYFMSRRGFAAWDVLVGCIGGTVGATISIIQRGVSLTVNPYVPVSHVVFQGLVRVTLGIIFGGLLVVASKANITLGILENNAWSLFIFSVVAGFSERFVPDILDRIATD